MLHIPAKYARTRLELAAYPVPLRDDVSARWKGVSHSSLVQTIMDVAQEKGLGVQHEAWGVNRDGTDLWGTLEFSADTLPLTLPLADGLRFSLGVRHSNMGRYAIGFVVGAYVTVCTNGLLIGSFSITKKHTTGLDLPAAVRAGFDRYLTDVRGIAELKQTLVDTEVDDKAAAHTVMALIERDLLAGQYAKAVWDAWSFPAEEEFYPNNGWSLHNAVSQVAKQMSPAVQLRLLSDLPNVILCNN